MPRRIIAIFPLPRALHTRGGPGPATALAMLMASSASSRPEKWR